VKSTTSPCNGSSQRRNPLPQLSGILGAHQIALHEQTLADMSRILGPDHPHTLQSRNNLANGYQEMGRHAEAITLWEQTLADRTRILGSDHPDTVDTRDSLDTARRQQKGSQPDNSA